MTKQLFGENNQNRFITSVALDSTCGIEDLMKNKKYCGFREKDYHKLVKIREELNELYYENEELKKENKELSQGILKGLFENENAELRKENEQLKLELNTYKESNTLLQHTINRLQKENEQLKQALREQLEENGNAYCIKILDEIFDLKYDEWQRKMNETHTYDYIDWEKVLKDKGDVK